MIKGYIFYNTDKRWELGFLTGLDEAGKALFTTYNDYANWSGAFEALVRYQLRAA